MNNIRGNGKNSNGYNLKHFEWPKTRNKNWIKQSGFAWFMTTLIVLFILAAVLL